MSWTTPHIAGGSMTTPPGFGGRDFEEGLQEDLGAPPPEHGPREDNESGDYDSNELHAAGQTCARCGKVIEPGQDARRHLDGQWVHETCPA
jgi:hypothetical protein